MTPEQAKECIQYGHQYGITRDLHKWGYEVVYDRTSLDFMDLEFNYCPNCGIEFPAKEAEQE